MKPTKQQIDQAERLQELGLCQNATNWIMKLDSTDEDREQWQHLWSPKNPEYPIYDVVTSKSEARESYNFGIEQTVVGPLEPTFEEVWLELRDLVKIKHPLTHLETGEKNSVYAVNAFALELIRGAMVRAGNSDITTAAIEALLLLKGEG